MSVRISNDRRHNNLRNNKQILILYVCNTITKYSISCLTCKQENKMCIPGPLKTTTTDIITRHYSNTHIYWLFLWVWAGRSPRSRPCRGNVSYSGCSRVLWCCAHTHSPAGPCRTRRCWHAGCTCT